MLRTLLLHVALVTIVILLATRTAHAVTLTPATTYTAKYQQWIDQSRVPLPNWQLAVSGESCPSDSPVQVRVFASCTKPGSATMWLAPGKRSQYTTLHELGHQYDFHTADPEFRATFLRLNNQVGAPWSQLDDNGGEPAEVFAEVFALCAHFGPKLPSLHDTVLWTDGSFFGTDVTLEPKHYRAMCTLITRGASGLTLTENPRYITDTFTEEPKATIS